MAETRETVILIHGLWMPGLVLLPYQQRLRAAGFAARRFAYPSWRDRLAPNVERLARCIADTPASVIHLVAHSLGGLLVLSTLAQRPDARVGRVVLLGSPCAGCHCGATLASMPLLSALVGRTFADWYQAPRPELPPRIEVGIIAGTRRVGFGLLIPGLPRPNDGLIAVAETHLAGATDDIALPVNHSGMLISRLCVRQTVSFLRSGKFVHA